MDLRSQVFAPHRRRVPAGVKSLSQHQVGGTRQRYEPIKNGTTRAYHTYPGKLVFHVVVYIYNHNIINIQESWCLSVRKKWIWFLET